MSWSFPALHSPALFYYLFGSATIHDTENLLLHLVAWHSCDPWMCASLAAARLLIVLPSEEVVGFAF
jgi:hypothetical protein